MHLHCFYQNQYIAIVILKIIYIVFINVKLFLYLIMLYTINDQDLIFSLSIKCIQDIILKINNNLLL